LDATREFVRRLVGLSHPAHVRLWEGCSHREGMSGFDPSGHRSNGPISQLTVAQNLLREMLANLLDNAIRHTPNGTRIELSLRKSGSMLIACLADDGPGIPPEDRANVFRRFYRLERSRTTPGSGLGLALVAAVAEMHAIEIRLEDNEPGLRISLVLEAHQQFEASIAQEVGGELARTASAIAN
jgi:signal transduction histidine kinase